MTNKLESRLLLLRNDEITRRHVEDYVAWLRSLSADELTFVRWCMEAATQ